jgi:EAL domain-containing protein (putative c-di-GMP-specific phosphodiesterase class I)
VEPPDEGPLYPLEFIPLAEESGQIGAIGEWILREACRGLILLKHQHPIQPPLTMSINISAKQFSQPDMADRVAAITKDTGVDPRCLVLEITESMIMEDVESAVETMNELRDMGINIHIDDFGTGYSSLSYLDRFPVNALKIDRSFINKLEADGRNGEVILSIVSLANSLNFEVIAEGVEREDQLNNIKDLHCQYGQGYLFARPMEAAELEAWMKAEKVLA